MRQRWKAAAPYLVGLGGVAAITVAIGAVRPWLEVPNLATAYVLLILWLGSRWGWPAAVASALLAFSAYDWFFVPPYGTLWVSGPRELVNLAVLLAAALAGGRLTASMAAQRAGAAAEALESGILYELAIAALREPPGQPALHLLCQRAVTPGGLEGLSLLGGDSTRLELVAGPPLAWAEQERARWALENGVNLGARLSGGRLELTRTFPPQPGPAYLVLTGGVAVLRLPEKPLEPAQRRLLAALLGLAGLLLDRRRAAAEAERARALEASDRLKTAVLSSISHELKNPIASLRAGLTTLLMPRAGLGAEQLEMVAGLDRQASRLDRLVGDLLAMSRLEAGVPPERSPHDLGELVGATLHALGPTLADLRVELELSPALPPVLVDELQVERLLTNLLENAAEWTPPGGRVLIGARALDRAVEVWVENQGPDIPPPDLDQLFEKFWSRRRGGSGLGLAIARRVVEAHGGYIRAENTRGGPRFTFSLPVAKERLATSRS